MKPLRRRPRPRVAQVVLFELAGAVEAGEVRQRAMADPAGARAWLRAMTPEREEWIAQATPVEIAEAVEAILVEEGDAP